MTASSDQVENVEKTEQSASGVDYEAIAHFLMAPFLDNPAALKFHVETLAGGKKLWLRAAFDETEDKGRIFGRGGRNINAIRTVVAAAAKLAGMTVNLSVFGEPEPERSERSERGDRDDRSSYGGRSGRGGGRSNRGDSDSSRGRGADRTPPPERPSTNPAPPKKKPR